jgi:hypothetical protein
LGLKKKQKCASIQERIKNLEEEIWEKRYPDLKKNKNNLPYNFKGSKLKETVNGHEILLTIAYHNLDNAWKEWYDNGCDKPPPPPVPGKCPETGKDVAKDVAKVAGTAVALYVSYKIIRAVAVSFFATPVVGVASLAVP